MEESGDDSTFQKRLVGGWDPVKQASIGRLTQSVTSFSNTSKLPAGNNQDITSMSQFFQLYPDLAAEDFVGDGHSCQFIAVGQAACSSPVIAGKLRKLAVEEIRKKWQDFGDVVLSEVSDQSGIPLKDLDQQRCLELLAGSGSARPIWGNHATLAQLPNIVQKNIVVLTSSNGKPFKYNFMMDGALESSDTIHIGFLPELHFFALKVRERPITRKAGDRGEQSNCSFKNNLSKGPCGPTCAHDTRVLVLCTTCNNPFHHVCAGECSDLNTCRRCEDGVVSGGCSPIAHHSKDAGMNLLPCF